MGALGLTPDPTQAPTPAMSYAPMPGAPISGGLQLPGSPGYSPLSGALSVLQSLQPAQGSPQGDAFRNKQYDTASAMIGDPSEVTGALSRVRTARDAKTSGQMASIQRAMSVLGKLDNNAGQLQQLSRGAGFLASAAPGTADRSFGDAASSVAAEIERQRAFERQNALDMSSLGSAAAEIPEQAATADLADIYSRMHEGEAIGANAAMGDYRQGVVNSRNLATGAQLVGRITAADIAGNKNRFAYLGTNPQDATQGIYLDKTNGQQYAGPPVAKPGGGSVSAAEYKYKIYLAAHPGDEAGALDYVAGHKKMEPADIRKAAETLAQHELGPGAEAADVDKRAQDIYNNITTGFGGGTPAPTGGASAPPPPKPVTPPPPVESRVAGKTVWVAPDGTHFLWTGKGWKPQ